MDTDRVTKIEDEPYFSVKEIADKYKVSTASVYRAANSGELDGVKVGKHLRIGATALQAWVKKWRDPEPTSAA